jgi:hypothetical protein
MPAIKQSIDDKQQIASCRICGWADIHARGDLNTGIFKNPKIKKGVLAGRQLSIL